MISRNVCNTLKTHIHEKTESKGNNIFMNLKVNIWYKHLYSGEDNQFNSVLLKKNNFYPTSYIENKLTLIRNT